MRTVVRGARAADQPALLELQRRASFANPGDRALLLANPDIIELPAEQLRPETACLAEVDGQIAGFAVVLLRADGDADLDGLFVEPDLWRKGIGRALVERSAELAAAMGASTLVVVGNPHAVSFYRAVGFVGDEVVTLQYGEGLLMRLAL